MQILIVDDEAPSRKQMRHLLSEYPEVTNIVEAEEIETALALTKKQTFDAIFLDIQMPKGSGFDLLPLLEHQPPIVFVTAYDQFAVKAFEANAIDYLLKPVHPKRLQQTFERLKQQQRPIPTPPGKRLEKGEITILRDGGQIALVKAQQIYWIEAEGIYCCLRLEGGRPFRMLRSISEWEAQLPGEIFTRLDRSFIVNLAAITAAEVKDRNTTLVHFRGISTPLALGRTAASKLRSLLKSSSPPI